MEEFLWGDGWSSELKKGNGRVVMGIQRWTEQPGVEEEWIFSKGFEMRAIPQTSVEEECKISAGQRKRERAVSWRREMEKILYVGWELS